MNDIQKLESEQRKKWLFIGSLVVIALAINYVFSNIRQRTTSQITVEQRTASQPQAFSHPERQIEARNADDQALSRRAAEEKEESERRKAVQMAAAEHARFLERHLNTGFARVPGLKTVAFAVACDGKLDHTLDAALVDHFKNESVQILPAFFTAEFVSDGLFNGAFDGSKETFTKLELAKYVDALVLAREEISYSANPSLENVLTAAIRLEVTSFSIPANALVQTWTFVANGAGFKKPEARAAAEERLAKQIAKDTKMSLPQ